MAQLTVEDLAVQAGVRDLDQQCCDDDLLVLSELCDPWKLIGQHLKLTQAQISAIDVDNRTTALKRLGALQRWKETFAFKATHRVLVSALLACGKTQQALDVCKILAQKQGMIVYRMVHVNVCFMIKCSQVKEE